MNCKPNDLAMIVHATTPYEKDWLGLIVRVIALSGSGGFGDPCWSFEGPRLIHPVHGLCIGLADRALRPIRPAGDDEPTQETRKLPADAGIQQLRETVRAFQAMRKAGVCP